jgi:hypothetical protein
MDIEENENPLLMEMMEAIHCALQAQPSLTAEADTVVR